MTQHSEEGCAHTLTLEFALYITDHSLRTEAASYYTKMVEITESDLRGLINYLIYHAFE
jgi:hypothetical protein